MNNAYCDYDSRNTVWECFGVLKTPIWDTVQVNSHVAGKRWLYHHLISGCILEMFCFSQAWTLLSNTAMDKGDDYMGFLTFCFASVFISILRSVPSQDFNFWPSAWFSSLCFPLFLLWCNKTMQSKSWKFQVAFTACSHVLLVICLSSFSVKLATVVTTVLQRILFIISINIIKFHVKKQK